MYMTDAAAQRLDLKRYLLLVALCLFTFVPGIATIPPTDRDESRFVQATKQMVESGDYVDIRFQEDARYKKPAGIYWLQAATVLASGQGSEAPIWIYRLVSVLGGIAAVLVTAWLGARMFGLDAGLVAGAAFAGILVLGFEARIAKTDAVLLALITAAQASLAHLYLSWRERRPAPAAPYLFWIAQGAAILVKGPIGLGLSALTMLGLLVLDRDRGWLRQMRFLPGLAILLAVAAPWLLLITWKSGGAFWRESLGDDFIAKIGSGQESHGMPPGFYAVLFVALLWPFVPMALAGGLKALGRFRDSPALLFCLCWYVPYWLAIELVPTKLPHYILPAYPAFILAMAWGLTASEVQAAPLAGWRLWLWRIGLAGFVLVTAALAIIAAGIAPYVLGRFSLAGLLAAGLFVLAGMLGAGLGPPMQAPRRALLTSVAGGAALGVTALFVVPALKPLWLSPQIVSAFERVKHCEDSRLISVGYSEPSLVFLSDTGTGLMKPRQAARALAGDPCAVVAVEKGKRRAFISHLPGGADGLERLATVRGINYSKGQDRVMLLFRSRDTTTGAGE